MLYNIHHNSNDNFSSTSDAFVAHMQYENTAFVKSFQIFAEPKIV